MGQGYNHCTFVGNLGRDVSCKAAGQTSAANVSLAVNERRKNKQGEYEDAVEWINLVMFGKTAENCAKFCKKGSQVFVEGRMQTRKYTGKDGAEKYATEIVCDRVLFLGGKSEGQQQREEPAPMVGISNDSDQDIPF